MLKPVVHIAITGAAGQIGYALMFRIASGEMLGKDQAIFLRLLDVPDKQIFLKSSIMELNDCAFPLLKGVTSHSDPEIAFSKIDIAILIGSQPRKPGMERRDLLESNAKTFMLHGYALNKTANPNVRVLVVGNPVNTNTYIAMQSAPNLSNKQFTAMLRLDYNRALFQLSTKSKIAVNLIENLIVWGNHSSSIYPDYRFANANGQKISGLINDEYWNRNIFIPNVRERGTLLLKKRGLSSAASAASAVINHIRDWILGSQNRWVTMGVISDGSYGIPKNVVFGMPVTTENGEYKHVLGLKIDPFSQQQFDLNLQELIEEYNIVKNLLKENTIIEK